MNDHCHLCGQEQSLDDAAAVAANFAMVELAPHDDGTALAELQTKARAFLDDYLTARHNRLVALRMPTL